MDGNAAIREMKDQLNRRTTSIKNKVVRQGLDIRERRLYETSGAHATVQNKVNIDPEFFFRDFLTEDPAYAVVAHVLDRLRGEMRSLLGLEKLSLSNFIDMTSIEYDMGGEVVVKKEAVLKALAKAMKNVDVTRETLQRAAGARLTPEQITEGPTSIRVPVELLSRKSSFRRFVTSLSSEYHDCQDYCTLMRSVCGLKIHQKAMFLLFGQDGNILAYFYPAWHMQEMRESIIAHGNRLQ